MNMITESKVAKIEEIGSTNDYVYDIEVPNDHMFYANNILVHNTDSIFVTFDRVIKSYYKDKYDETPEDEKIDKVIELNEKVAKYINNTMLYEMLRRHNTSPTESAAVKFNPNLKQELVIRRSIFPGMKKKYAIWVVRKEGKITDNITYSGLEIVRSDYPKFTRKMMSEIIDEILKMNASQSRILCKLSDYKEEYMKLLDDWNQDAASPCVWSKDLKGSELLDRNDNDDFGESDTRSSVTKSAIAGVKGMLIYNAIYGNEFKVMDRGYCFKVEPFTPSYFKGEARDRLIKLANSGLLGKTPEFKYITLPKDKHIIPKNITIDRAKMLETAYTKRLEHICSVYKINISKYDSDDLGIL